MKARAYIFDIYGTLLEVGPSPADAEEKWVSLWRETFGLLPAIGRLELSAQCSKIIAARHSHARQVGIPWPEVCWPTVLKEAVPGLAEISVPVFERFTLRHISLGHTVWITQETASLLHWLAERDVSLGIASNAQAYTSRELEEGLGVHGLTMDIFQPELCFWSYQHGFSKPDPHVFQWISTQLEAQGISCEATVMVGDRLDNDIEPAQRHGWQVWHRTSANSDWRQFRELYSSPLETAKARL